MGRYEGARSLAEIRMCYDAELQAKIDTLLWAHGVVSRAGGDQLAALKAIMAQIEHLKAVQDYKP